MISRLHSYIFQTNIQQIVPHHRMLLQYHKVNSMDSTLKDMVNPMVMDSLHPHKDTVMHPVTNLFPKDMHSKAIHSKAILKHNSMESNQCMEVKDRLLL